MRTAAKPLRRRSLAMLVVLAAVVCPVLAQTNAPAAASTNALPPALELKTNHWDFYLSAYTYIIPDEQDYIQPIFTADRDWLHLEARYNYEDLETGSTWVGYNLSGGRNLKWELTPMAGLVFGNTTGGGPGYRGSLGWWKLELYSEGELVFDSGDVDDSFLYTWSELTLSPVEWFRFGLVTQGNWTTHSDRDEFLRGLLVGFIWKRLDLTACVFNLDESKPTLAFAVGWKF